MTKHTRTILVVILALSGSPLAQAITVRAQVDNSQEIYPDQAITYQIVVEGGKADAVDPTPLTPYHYRQLGTSSNTRIINGRASSETTTNFSLTITEPGVVNIPPVTVSVGGKAYHTNPVQFTVAKPGTTDKLRIEVELSETTCFVGQPITMTVRWLILTQAKNGAFNVPVFESSDFLFDSPPGAQGQDLEINGRPVKLQQTQEQINGMDVGMISFEKIIIPIKSGTLTLDPVTVSADVVVGRVRTGSLFEPYRSRTQRFAVNSDPVTLTVKSLPEEGQPEGYYGLVGHYHISTNATPTKVNVGDPITLTIRAEGELLSLISWPDLEAIDELTQNFKIPPDKSSPVIQNDVLIFTQTLRPNSADVTRIPPIPLPTFDVEKKRYVTVQSDPVPLQVTATQTLTTADMHGTTHAPLNREVEAIREGLAANYDDENCLVDQHFNPLAALIQPGTLGLWALPLLGLIGSIVAKGLTCSTPQQKQARKKRRAANLAVQAIKSVASQSQDQRHQAMAQTLQHYLGDRFERTAASITAGDAYDILLRASNNEAIAQNYRRLLESCEAAQYAPMAAQIDDAFIDQALDLIRQNETEARS